MPGKQISTAASGGPFRVRAEDADDLAVVSAYLQDAVLPVVEIAYDAPAERFVLVAARYLWEKAQRYAMAAKSDEPAERVHCWVRFYEVTAVKVRGVDPKT